MLIRSVALDGDGRAGRERALKGLTAATAWPALVRARAGGALG